jgi:hypothetical protein
MNPDHISEQHGKEETETAYSSIKKVKLSP